MSSNVILTSNIAQLQLISQYVSTTVGFVILFFGVVGNLLNILTLIKLGNHKHNTSSLYILVKSFFDLIVLFVGLFAVILNHGLSINSMSTNVVWCKARIPLIYINGFSSFTCLCLHSIDTFLATSNSAYWRRKSNVRTARILIIGFLFLWIGHELPYFFIQDTFNLRCVSTNGAYTQYSTYFIAFGLFAIIPVSIVSIFGYLSYRHVHSQLLEDTHRPLSRLTKQMTSMALFQIINIVGFSIPNGIIQAYFLASANLNKDPYRQAQEQFVQLFFNVLLCGLYAGLDGVIHYISELSEEWKKQKVSIALVGQSGSGKSTLINRFRSLLPDDEGAADVAGGIRECTTGIDEYPMKGTNVIYYDLPGVGT
ncbi:unnamed protein product [Rotaria socialis]|uniref:G-protein coupled receptors family 1 profile domain-containing protein n=1 Tax=Rotaria socialis TaxID=392032 RepID=A0A819BNB9_9BILA|nr:unnamed protein product [Rotaria socialis]